jgi:F-type H+-transporting ATPase subunit alpha
MLIQKDLSCYGVTISIGSGVVSIQGFLTAFVGEVFKVASGSSDLSYGMVVNLCRDETMNLIIGSLMFNPDQRVCEGAKVTSMSRLASILLGDYVIGSILDPLGNLLLNTGSVNAQYRWVIESPAPGIIDRQSVFEPLQTGIISIDAMVPIGLGQRELVVGDRQTGKTSIGVDTVLNQKHESVLSVYVPIGQKAASVLEVFLSLVRRDAIFYLSLLVASASSSAVCQFLCAYTGTALAEFFMLLREIPAFIMLDDLSRHAVAYREIYLLLRRPPGREAYPGEIFFVHSRLLERSAKLSSSLGGGSVTAFPVIETLAGDVSAYITTNVISITDGQIFLSIDLFLSGIKPAIDVGLSVTRVGSAAQWDGMKLVAGSYKLELAQFAELQSFSQFAADLGEDTKARLARGKRLIEMLKQFCGSPMSLMSQVGILSLANQDVISLVDISEVKSFISLYLAVPAWTFLYIPVRSVSKSIVQLFISNRSSKL